MDLSVGQDHVGLEFAGGKNALLRREELERELAEPCSGALEEEAAPPLPWPQSTFHQEDENATHYPGSHWQPFVEESKEILLRLPEIVRCADLKCGYGHVKKPPRNPPEDWPKGGTLASWPSGEMGIAISLQVTEQANEIREVYPAASRGVPHALRFRRASVWPGGMAAQIEADWCGANITFFDIDFPADRCWYEAGALQEFVLTGIAYSAEPAKIFEIPVTHHPEQVAWQRMLAQRDGAPEIDEVTTLDLRGTIMFAQVEGGIATTIHSVPPSGGFAPWRTCSGSRGGGCGCRC